MSATQQERDHARRVVDDTLGVDIGVMPGDRIRIVALGLGADPRLRRGEVYVAGDQHNPDACCLLHPDVTLLPQLGDKWEVVR